jgi:hypothetical protein
MRASVMKLDQGRVRKRWNEGGILEWTIALYVGQGPQAPAPAPAGSNLSEEITHYTT